MARAHDFGRSCEAAAAAALQAAGWTILERNYRFGHKEIDLIARRAGVIAFVEVKGRRGVGYGHPLDAITARKRLEIARVARAWIASHGHRGAIYRFDAIAVQAPRNRPLQIDHVEDAWRL